MPYVLADSFLQKTTIESVVDEVALVVQGMAAQTGSLQDWRDSAGAVLVRVASDGMIYCNTNGSGLTVANDVASVVINRSTTPFVSAANLTTAIPIIAKGGASQTADLQQWQDSAGTVRASVSAGFVMHAMEFGGYGGVAKFTAGYKYFEAGDGTRRIFSLTNDGSVPHVIAAGWVTTQVVFAVKGAASQTADLQQWQNSAAAVLSKVDSLGNPTFGTLKYTDSTKTLMSDANSDFTIAISATGNPYPNQGRSIILRPQFDGLIKFQYGNDTTYQVSLHPAGGFVWAKAGPSQTVIDVPSTGGNGQYDMYFGTNRFHIEAGLKVGTRGSNVYCCTLNSVGGNPYAGTVSPVGFSVDRRGTADATTTSYPSHQFVLEGTYWDGAATRLVVGGLYTDPVAKALVFLIGRDVGNQSGQSRRYTFDDLGNLNFVAAGASTPTGIQVMDATANPPLDFNRLAGSSTGGLAVYSGGGGTPVLRLQTGGSSTTAITLQVRAVASQTASIQQWQTSAAEVLASLGPDGSMIIGDGSKSWGTRVDIFGRSVFATLTAADSSYGSNVSFCFGDHSLFPYSHLITGATATPSNPKPVALIVTAGRPVETPLYCRGAAAQTANLQEWQNSAGTILSKVTSAGEPEVVTAGAGVIIASPNGTRYRVTVADDGALVTAAA